MKKYFFYFISIATLFIACQNTTSITKNDHTNVLDTFLVNVSEVECYSYTKNKDTANLSFTNTNGIIIGKLNYKLFEKDSNEGMIEGELKGDTLILAYTFNAEGRVSEREVVFLKKDGQLFEGIGDVEEKNGKFVFKAISTLNFKDGLLFNQIDCNKKGY